MCFSAFFVGGGREPVVAKAFLCSADVMHMGHGVWRYQVGVTEAV